MAWLLSSCTGMHLTVLKASAISSSLSWPRLPQSKWAEGICAASETLKTVCSNTDPVLESVPMLRTVFDCRSPLHNS